MTEANWTDGALDRDATLAALPGLLALARQVVVTALDAGDPETAVLRQLLEECVIGAHRICLREQLRSGGEILEA